MVIIFDKTIPAGKQQEYLLHLIKNNEPIQYLTVSSQSSGLGNYNPQNQISEAVSTILCEESLSQDLTFTEGNPVEKRSRNREHDLLDYSNLETNNQLLETFYDSSLNNLSSMTNGMTACNHSLSGNTSRNENPNITGIGNIVVIDSLKQDSVLTNTASERVNERSIPELPQTFQV